MDMFFSFCYHYGRNSQGFANKNKVSDGFFE